MVNIPPVKIPTEKPIPHKENVHKMNEKQTIENEQKKQTVQKLQKLLYSADNDTVLQGLSLLNALEEDSESRRKILDFEGKKVEHQLVAENLSYGNFMHAVVQGTWEKCDLTGACFQSAWIAVKGFSECQLKDVDCTGAVITDETGFLKKEDLPKHIQSVIADFYPIVQLRTQIKQLEEN